MVSGRDTCKVQAQNQCYIVDSQSEASRRDYCQSFGVLQEQPAHHPILWRCSKKPHCKFNWLEYSFWGGIRLTPIRPSCIPVLNYLVKKKKKSKRLNTFAFPLLFVTVYALLSSIYISKIRFNVWTQPSFDIFTCLQKLKDVQDFLKVPYRELKSRQVKIHKGSLSQQVENWDDIQKTIKGTHYESFLHADYRK